jgi:hypothetical protein
MSRIKFNLVAVVVLTLLASACRSGPPKIVNEPGVTRLNGDQARAHVSGNTEKWEQGTIYYSPNGKLEMVWRKVKTNGVWNVLDDGNICFEVKKWKNQTCHYYVNNNGAITMIDGVRNRGVVEIVEGKRLPQR